MEDTTTLQVYRNDRDRLGKYGEKGDAYRDILRNLLNGEYNKVNGDFQSKTVPESGQLKIREAPGKTIEYRVV